MSHSTAYSVTLGKKANEKIENYIKDNILSTPLS